MKIEAALICTAITTVREKAGDDIGPIRKVLTLSGPVPVGTVLSLFATQKDRESFAAKYWDDDDKLRIAHLAETMVLENEIVGGTASLQKGLSKAALVFEGADVKKIRLKPEDGRIVHLTLAVHVQSNEQVGGKLDAMLECEVSLMADRAQAEMELLPSGKDDDQGQIPLSGSRRATAH